MKTKFSLSSLLLAPVLAVLTACGGGGGGSTTTTTPPTTTTPTLQSIAVTPVNSTIPIGTTQQMVATGTYSDGKITPLTTGVTWAARGSVVSVVYTSGLVTGKAVGTDTVTATVGTVVGQTDLTVKAPYTAIVAGGNQSFARKADGTLYSWGANLWGQLGDATTTGHASPALVTGGISTWTQVTSGELHTLAIRSDGSLWAWGRNANGQLGDGTNIDRATPVQIGTSKDWVSVSAGKAHTLAVNKTGLLYGWGMNFNGQLGDNSKVDKRVPTKIGTLTGWIKVAAGADHSLALRSTDQGLYSWGANASGQLGNGGVADVLVPTRVGTLTWKAIAAGSAFSLAIRSDGALFAWGDNTYGQLGNGANAKLAAPTQITTVTSWATVAAGFGHTLAIRNDGTLWTWGSNSEGQLGDDLGADTSSPSQIGTSTNWTSVSAGLEHSFGLQSDSTIWGWGRNLEGQQGNGKLVRITVPTQLP